MHVVGVVFVRLASVTFLSCLVGSAGIIVRTRSAMKKVTSIRNNRTETASSSTEAASSSTERPGKFNNVIMPEILQDDTAHRRLLEVGSELMLQQHLDYNGYLTTSEQTKRKNIISNAPSGKSFNDTSKYLIDKLREPRKTELLRFISSNCGLQNIQR